MEERRRKRAKTRRRGKAWGGKKIKENKGEKGTVWRGKGKEEKKKGTRREGGLK